MTLTGPLQARDARGLLRDSFLVFVLGVVLGAAWSWRPSFWYDEVATLYSSQRSRPDLSNLLGHIDAVHGLYYVGMRYWFEMFGASEFSARFPSALAAGTAGAGVVVLGALISTRRVAGLSGILFVMLPSVTWAAVEARGYALTATAAVWLTVILLAALRFRRWWLWVLYAGGLAVSIVLFVYLLTLVPAHLLTILLLREARRSWLGWTSATAAGLVVAAPLVALVRRESVQVAWIPPLDDHLPRAVAEYQWFVGAPWFAVLFAVLVVAGSVALVRNGRHLPPVLSVTVPWVLVPMALLLVYSLLRTPVYLPRYFTFTTPAVALVGGLCLAALTRQWWQSAAVLAVFAVAASPSYLAQREQWAKPSGMDFSTVNGFAGQNVRPGDCVLFDTPAWNPTSLRLVKNVRPEAFDGTRDIGLGATAASRGSLWDDELAVPDVAGALDSCSVVWFFTDYERDTERVIRHTSNEVWTLPPYHFEDTEAFAALTRSGLRIDERRTFNVTQAVKLVR
ncbi:glycosyltransferase family 39 protein [Rhodococcus jostii]|uniref:Mannosyltransferase n=1 Tax=Rhodococcus jostii TaxID=132919 RepID=A0A1H5C8C6_RHOJO|nr:mannosyltransferase [Rhodococcus jostii]SED62540.1 mannosyltransferase [Rhodococcus jostii]